MGPKKRQGSMKSSAPSQLSVMIKEEDSCKIKFSDTRILVVIESISGFEGNKGKGKDVKYPLDISFKVSLGEEIIGLSETISVPNTEKFDINYNLVYTLPVEPSQVLVSQPLTITMLNAGVKEKRKSSSRGTRTSTTKQSSKLSPTSLPDNQLLEANIDLLPLVFGEIEVEQRVGDSVEVLVRLDGAKLVVPKNLLYVTLQNLHNPPDDLITSDVVGVTVSLRCLSSSKIDLKELEEPQDNIWFKMNFGPGILSSTEPGVEIPIKRWFSVQTGPPVLSQYRNIPDNERIRDPYGLSVDSNKSNLLLSWNQIKRIFLDSNQQDRLILDLIEKHEWQMEIGVKYGKKVEEKKKGKTVAPGNIKTLDNINEIALYQVKLDMSELLHPGVNCCKVFGHLESIQKVILESTTLAPATNSPQSVQSQLSHVSLKNQKAVSTSNLAFRDDEEMYHKEKGNKVRDFYGRQSYITVVVELYSSFRPRKTTEQLLLNLSDFVKEEVEVCPIERDDISSPYQARVKYKRCLLDNIKFLNELYQEFNKPTADEANCVNHLPDEKSTFEEELDKSGALDYVRRNLGEAVTSLLKDTSCTLQSGLCEAYCKIVEETQEVLDEASKVEVPGPRIRATSDELLQAAREASEENNYKQAEEFLHKRLYYYGKTDPDKWRDLAVTYLRHCDFSKAKQALLSALCIQPRHRDSLLMLAVLLSIEGKLSEANMIFEALTTFYPRFYKGWFTYCCFYDSIENKQGSDVCLSLGSICLNDREKDEGEVLSSNWSSDVMEQDSDGFLLTAVYLLSLNLIQFAEMCLSHHRQEAEEGTVAYLYYLSVAHHLQGKFKESNSHLKQALSISWNDERLWNLMGHNLYRLEDWEKAVDCYQLVLDEPDPIPLYSLTYHRMGRIEFQRGDYEKAVVNYLKAVSLCPSLQSWIGLAKVSYWMGRMEDAELAAREANRLDDRASEPWACLALVNLQNCPQPLLARHCLSLAAQCGEIGNDLLKEINQILESYEETPPEFPTIPSEASLQTV